MISMTAFDRLQYAEPVIASYLAAVERLDEPVTLVVAVDHSDRVDEMVALLPTDEIIVQSDRVGLQRNTLAALQEAWAIAEEQGEDFVLHLEDDLLLAPDALRLAAWMRDHYRDDDRVGFVSLTEIAYVPGPGEHHAVALFEDFECHVWGTWRPGWERMAADWPHEWETHWAARFAHELCMYGLRQARPLLSRSRSIGVHGQHCDEHYHEAHNPRVYADDVDLADGDYHESATGSVLAQ
jgi:hypothetical protein